MIISAVESKLKWMKYKEIIKAELNAKVDGSYLFLVYFNVQTCILLYISFLDVPPSRNSFMCTALFMFWEPNVNKSSKITK